MNVESVAETYPLQLDIALHEGGLFRQRRGVLTASVHGGAQQLTELEEHRQGSVARTRANQRRDRVQGVEEEMRFDFETQRVELGTRQIGLQPRLAHLEVLRPLIHGQPGSEHEK